ncbi:MAG: hypothetical protein AAGD43_04665 [Pseudomonadota bacterium]
MRSQIVEANAAGAGEREIVPHQDPGAVDPHNLEKDSDAAAQGPDQEWSFWDQQISAALIAERRFRQEAQDAEEVYFGPDHDPGTNSEESQGGAKSNQITDKTALVHANIDVLKPLLYSEVPQPVVRRRFRGDGEIDETDLMAAEAGQRLAAFLVDTEDFDAVMRAVRDDWIIAGRGNCRALYKATTAMVPIDQKGGTLEVPVKTSERVVIKHWPWRRYLCAPTESWGEMPWEGFETSMTRTKFTERFGVDKANDTAFVQQGLVDASNAVDDDDQRKENKVVQSSETGHIPNSPFDTAKVWEIWNKDEGYVVWWSPHYRGGVLDREDDPLGLEGFYPNPKPILDSTKGESLNPRPSIKYYERRADEINLATKKLKTILEAISVSALFPGEMQNEVKSLLDGENTMIGVASWIQLMEKGGTNNIIQWLPLQHMVTAMQALIALREQAKQAMFEASGVSDIMRAQGDPNETATAQNLKGRYAGMRLSDRQRAMANYARDCLRIMVEVALEHFDTKRIAEITGLNLPMTELQREAMKVEQQQIMQAYAASMQQYQKLQQAVEAGLLRQEELPPAPQEPELPRIPETSWELVHGRLRDDFMRKISLTIETQSTILADEQADKEARVEFLGAFANFVATLSPLAGSGQFDFKTIKELLMFGIRGFPQSRTLEGLISSLPDEPQGEPPEDTAVTVAKIKAEVDKYIADLEAQTDNKDRQAKVAEKGVDLMADAARMTMEPA